MLRFLLAFAAVTSTLALPIPAPSVVEQGCPESSSVEILSYDTDSKTAQIRFDCESCFETNSTPDHGYLYLTLQASHFGDTDSVQGLRLVINDKALEVETYAPQLSQGSRKAYIEAFDTSGAVHELEGELSINVITPGHVLGTAARGVHRSSFRVHSVDGRPVDDFWYLDFDLKPSSGGYLDLDAVSYLPHAGSLHTAWMSCAKSTIPNMSPTSTMSDAAAEIYLANELETLRVLEEEALRLQTEIATRKQGLSVSLAEYRTQRPLSELIERCDGIVCAAQQVATRIYDQLNLATTSRLDRKDVQHILEPPQNVTRLSYETNGSQNNTWSETNYLNDVRHVDGYFAKALAFIAGILGLTALYMFIRRKCMSMRGRVERAADREERRTARAYRRAARRAEMRKRLSCFMPTFSCFAKKQQQERMTNYDEKRALILQDALLEQDFRQMEKGDVMEAEIRQFRNASAIVAGIVGGEGKGERLMLVRDPPPSQVPLPMARSRASTATLPSYNSDDLPDYSSLPEAMNYNTTTDGFSHYRPTDSMQESIILGPPSIISSSNTRSTPVSSIPNISRRPSAETLRTRSSRVGSLGSV